MPPERRQSYDDLLAENREMYDALAETGEMGRSCDAGATIYDKYGWAGLENLAEPIFEAVEILMRNEHQALANRLLKGLLA